MDAYLNPSRANEIFREEFETHALRNGRNYTLDESVELAREYRPKLHSILGGSRMNEIRERVRELERAYRDWLYSRKLN